MSLLVRPCWATPQTDRGTAVPYPPHPEPHGADLPREELLTGLFEASADLHPDRTALDVANAVVFLASEEAGYMTGQVLSVNGGMLMP